MAAFRPTATWETLQARARLLTRVRSFFDQRGFCEVQTPLLSGDTVIDRHLDPIPVRFPADGFGTKPRTMWLQTSPEFAMKRLLASGGTSIYQLGPAFRLGEAGRHHNPEFTLLEWYRVGDDLHQGMERLGEFTTSMLGGTFQVRTFRDVCVEYGSENPFELTAEGIRDACVAARLAIPAGLRLDDWDSWLDYWFSSVVQPQLGHAAADIVCDYPASQAALAQVRPGKPAVAERFELFVNGLELANGYHELLDAEELARRNQQANAWRSKDGKTALPEDSQLLAAMRSGLPPCAGVAVGFDRLLMVHLGLSSIDEVLCFPIDRA